MNYRAMNARLGDVSLLNEKGYIFEPKLDGYRALFFYDGKTIRFISRNEIEMTDSYPMLQAIKKNIKAKSCILDGEIIAYDKKGKISFNLLQQGQASIFLVFDILMKNGKSVMKESLLERKKILKSTITNGKYIKKVTYSKDGKKLWKQAKKEGWEGLMAKQIDSRYYPGARKSVWEKIKFFSTIDGVIVGFTQEKRTLSALVVALYENNKKKLQFLSKVGTGFNEQEQDILYEKLTLIQIKKSSLPLNETFELSKLKNVVWVKPKYVAEIKYVEITKDQHLRVPVFVRLRTDKKPKDCTIQEQLKQ